MAMENCTGRWRPQRREKRQSFSLTNQLWPFWPLSLQNKLDPAAQPEYVIHCDILFTIGLWYLGDASKVFMLANHALTRRYLRSTGQLVGRRQAFFQDVQHCFPILLPCSGSQETTYHSIKIFSMHAGRMAEDGRCTSIPIKKIIMYRTQRPQKLVDRNGVFPTGIHPHNGWTGQARHLWGYHGHAGIWWRQILGSEEINRNHDVQHWGRVWNCQVAIFVLGKHFLSMFPSSTPDRQICHTYMF